jgi:hypothetical protein
MNKEITILAKGRITPMINTSVYHLSPNSSIELKTLKIISSYSLRFLFSFPVPLRFLGLSQELYLSK